MRSICLLDNALLLSDFLKDQNNTTCLKLDLMPGFSMLELSALSIYVWSIACTCLFDLYSKPQAQLKI